MTQMPSIVTTEWLAANIGVPKLRVIDVTTFLRQPGATTGQFRTMPYSGAAVSTSSAMKADFFKQLSDVPGDTSFAINGTGMRLTPHPEPGGSGHYKFWSGRETYEKGRIPGAVYADIDDFSDPDAKLAYTSPPHELFALIAATRLPILALLALSTASLQTILTEALPAGLLPQVGSDLAVTEAMAGQTITVNAVGSLLAAILLATATKSWRRRPLLIAAISGSGRLKRSHRGETRGRMTGTPSKE